VAAARIVRRHLQRALVLGVALTLGGCASREFDIRTLPPETPAADNAAAAEATAALGAAIAGQPAQGENSPASESAPAAAEAVAAYPVTPADAPSMDTYDPWGRLNRFTYRFNARFDRAIFVPAANTYRRLPSPVVKGVHNFFGNLSEVDSVVNYVLQLRLKRAAQSLGRLAVNSTLGLAGLFDVATRFKMPAAPTGFSDTLGTWGMHPGPYLVIPLIGPSTLRDGIGVLGDYGVSYGVNLANLYRGNQEKTWSLGVVNAVDQRAHVSFRYYDTASPFEYENVRFLYVRKRLLEDEGLRRRKRPQAPAAGAPAGQ
jgi:phospholipid-binding lipoprotein MlaA